MPDICFSTRVVRQTLLKLYVNKATGPDGIPPIVLCKCAPELAPILSRLFHLSYSVGTFPTPWKHAHVFPVPKNGEKSNPSNYRPIALTFVLSKIMESIINKCLLSFLESSNLLSDHQYCFRCGRSTGDLLTYVTNLWSSALYSFGESRILTLDISKAFDRVWHKGLIANLVPNYLCGRRTFLQAVPSLFVSMGLSKQFPINSGVSSRISHFSITLPALY